MVQIVVCVLSAYSIKVVIDSLGSSHKGSCNKMLTFMWLHVLRFLTHLLLKGAKRVSST